MVLFTNGDTGHLAEVNLTTLACTIVKEYSGSASNTFSQTFFAPTAGNEEERLLTADAAGSGLGTIDVTTWAQQPIRHFDGALGNCDLTGSAAGKLYGFFLAGQPLLVELDPATAGTISSRVMSEVSIQWALTFAFWGGEFWIFTTPGPNRHASVQRFNPQTGIVSPPVLELPFAVMGAGVSTCAPTVLL